MRIVSCHIAGFGKFVGVNLDYTNGFNAVLEENGWGKTTLSVFLKAMFFGMESNSKKNELSEREHYRPWDGEAFGGSLTFTVGDKKYRIERTFGQKEKEDTFALFDEDTGDLSKDYTENIGEEIFLVDRDAFEKSIFIPQGVPAAEKSDSISAKMGDLAAARDDINDYDEAVRRLEEAKSVYTRRSSTNPGKLSVIRKEIAECREAAEKMPALAEGLAKQRAMLEEKRMQRAKLEKEKETLQARITEQSKREQELGAYLEKKNTIERLQTVREELDTFFGGTLPEEEEISKSALPLTI